MAANMKTLIQVDSIFTVKIQLKSSHVPRNDFSAV